MSLVAGKEGTALLQCLSESDRTPTIKASHTLNSGLLSGPERTLKINAHSVLSFHSDDQRKQTT
jgi:hypothetical protein